MNTAVYKKRRTPFYIFATVALFLAALVEIYILINNLISFRANIIYFDSIFDTDDRGRN